jgi:quercetin 2,3-dioxygenase
MKSTLHTADTRGHADHGWLKTFHSFSFANYFDQKRMGFGALRVLNDDSIEGGKGFGTHPHENMEIITIPLEGELAHRDSMNTEAVVKSGDIQVMSAGTGVEHSEYNHSQDTPVQLLQIWVIPNQQNVEPRYDQMTLSEEDRHNKLQQIISPNKSEEGIWIHQNAWFYLGKFDEGTAVEYTLKAKENGLYVFVIQGSIQVGDQPLHARDGYGIWEFDTVLITATTDAEFLLMDVPM